MVLGVSVRMRYILEQGFKVVLGLNIFGLVSKIPIVEHLADVWTWIQMLSSLIGIIYFLSNWRHKKKMQSAELEHTKLENLLLKNELENKKKKKK